MSNPPRVSVVLPVHNRREKLELSVNSILGQSFEDLELLVVDDGSTDGASDWLHSQEDPRLLVHVLPAKTGGGVARNVGLTAARGDYIAVMDSDDVAYPQRLEKQVAFFQANPGVHALGSSGVMHENGRQRPLLVPETDARIKASLLLVDVACLHPTMMYRRSFLDEHCLRYSASRRTDGDYELFIRLMQAGARFHNLQEPLLEYHRHGENASSLNSRHQEDKTPLRATLLGLFSPGLTHEEANALARLMQKGVELDFLALADGVAAGRKVMRDTVSRYGEDREVLAGIVRHYLKNVQQQVLVGHR